MLQVIANAFISGAIYATITAGFNLVYSVHRFFYLAHGSVLLVGGFAFYFALQTYHLHWIIAVLIAIAAAIILALLNEILIHRPLRQRQANNFSLFLASTASLNIIQGLLLYFNSSRTFTYQWPLNVIEIATVRITHSQLYIIGSAVIIFSILWVIMNKTMFGKSLQAISDSPVLARAIGLPVSALYLKTTILSAILAAFGGILMSLERDLRFDMGMEAILKGIIASIIGGIPNVPAAILGGFLLGLIENLSAWFLPSNYKTTISSVVLIVFLLLRPTGIIGSKFFPNR
jgi:branched-chain amino acid transport system permease protein